MIENNEIGKHVIIDKKVDV